MNWKFGALAALLALTAQPALADSCRTVTDAQIKQFHTPFRAQTVMHHDNDDDLIIEAVNTADTRYVKMSGSLTDDWTKSPLDAARDESDYRHNIRVQRWDCHIEKSEEIGGDMTDVWITQNEDSDTVLSRTWVSRALGLPLRIETYTGQGTERPGTATAVYEYSDVQAPSDSPPSP